MPFTEHLQFVWVPTTVRSIWGVELECPWFLTLALDGGQWSNSRPSHLTPGERAPSTHQYEAGWAHLDVQKNLLTLPISETWVIQAIQKSLARVYLNMVCITIIMFKNIWHWSYQPDITDKCQGLFKTEEYNLMMINGMPDKIWWNTCNRIKLWCNYGTKNSKKKPPYLLFT